MAIEIDGNSIETTATGYLVRMEDWSEGVAEIIAKEENVELGDRHWI